MKLDNIILFLKGEALIGNFTEEQENKLCDKAEELKTVGLNIFKARSFCFVNILQMIVAMDMYVFFSIFDPWRIP